MLAKTAQVLPAADVPRAPVPDRHGKHAHDVEQLRALARDGALACTYAAATAEQRRRLRGAVMAVAAPVVFTRLTRVLEIQRGHPTCAVSMTSLTDGCLDRFHDDLEAVTVDALANADKGIASLEGWLARRVQAATVDAHRRRRGARGAQQRPRLPAWLAAGLGHDPWLGHLAVQILTWVGVPASAGLSLWPLDGWVEQRAAVTGARGSDDARLVEREVEAVLAVMRTRPEWFANYVERPLGAKTPPVATAGMATDEPSLLLVEPHAVLDARLTELAGLALAAIERQAAAGADLTAAVADVLSRVFGSADLAHELADVPHGVATADEQVPALVRDPAALAGLVRAVGTILAPVLGRE